MDKPMDDDIVYAGGEMGMNGMGKEWGRSLYVRELK